MTPMWNGGSAWRLAGLTERITRAAYLTRFEFLQACLRRCNSTSRQTLTIFSHFLDKRGGGLHALHS